MGCILLTNRAAEDLVEIFAGAALSPKSSYSLPTTPASDRTAFRATPSSGVFPVERSLTLWRPFAAGDGFDALRVRAAASDWLDALEFSEG